MTDKLGVESGASRRVEAQSNRVLLITLPMYSLKSNLGPLPYITSIFKVVADLF